MGERVERKGYKEGNSVVGIFSKLQVKYRSDRFSSVGKRFGAVDYNLHYELELQRRRMHKADDIRRRALTRVLNEVPREFEKEVKEKGVMKAVKKNL